MSAWLARARARRAQRSDLADQTCASCANCAETPLEEQHREGFGTNGTIGTAPAISPAEVRGRLEWAARRLREERGLPGDEAAERARRVIAAELRNDPRLTPHQENARACLVCGEPGEVRRPLVAILTPMRGEFLWMHPGLCHSAFVQKQQKRVEELMRAATELPGS